MKSGAIITETPSGALAGLIELEGKVEAYKGVRYALPPVGVRRWRHAEPASAWDGIRSAENYGPACPQFPMPEGPIFYHPMLQTSEDCLFLNVWTPRRRAETGSLPVMVWIHGGGLFAGSGAYPEYDGARLASKGAVVVTINYRLGVLGYFAHPDLTAEDPERPSGNYGLGDMLEALRWVKKHISSFGGDPDNVTIFGQSAGGWSVSQLVASPLAKGLIHRAIAQSGVGNFPMVCRQSSVMGQPPAEKMGSQLVSDLSAANIDELRQRPAEKLINDWLGLGRMTQAVVDDWILPKDIYTIFEAGEQNDIPVLTGFNANEANNLAEVGAVPVPPTAEAYEAAARQIYGDYVKEFLVRYPPSDLKTSVYRAYRDTRHGWEAEAWARATKSVRSNSYLYYFSYTPDSIVNSMGAFHMAEIPYVFGNLDLCDSFAHPVLRHKSVSEEARALSDTMSDYWLAFARDGVPSAPGQPDWPAYDVSGMHMEFALQGPVVRSALIDGACDFHDEVNRDRARRQVFWTPLFDPSDEMGLVF